MARPPTSRSSSEAREAVCTDNTSPADGDCLDTDPATQNPPDVNITASSNVIADSARGVTFTGAAGAGGGIDIADRTKLANKATSIPLGTLSHAATDAKQADGDKAFATNKGAAANITIGVDGPISDDDTLFFDQNVNGKMESRERLHINKGAASRIFRLSFAQSGAGVYHTPGGSTTMKKATFETTYAIKYDATDLVDPKAVTTEAELVHDGVDTKARAYAIANAGSDDIANVRIKCDAGGTGECTVFLDCNDQDGMPYFGELSSSIAAGATTVLQAAAVGQALGVDSWAGRLSCDVLSNNDVSVQVLVRSDGSLLNNTYVDHVDR